MDIARGAPADKLVNPACTPEKAEIFPAFPIDAGQPLL